MISDFLFREMCLLARDYKFIIFKEELSEKFENIIYSFLLNEFVSDSDKQFVYNEFIISFDFKNINLIYKYNNEHFIDEFNKYILWSKIEPDLFSEDFIRKYKNNINFNLINNFNRYSIDFIKEFYHKLGFKYYSGMNVAFLREDILDFISLELDSFDWKYVSYYGNISINFIRKYYNKINFSLLMENDNIDNSIKEKFGVFI